MARQPDGDECSVRKPVRTPKSPELWVVPPGFKRLDERVWLRELGPYLNMKPAALARMVRKWGNVLHRERILQKTEPQWWVTPQVAMRLIAVVRARHGELTGKNYDPLRDRPPANRRWATERKFLTSQRPDQKLTTPSEAEGPGGQRNRWKPRWCQTLKGFAAAKPTAR